jgi:hypothetical protein
VADAPATYSLTTKPQLCKLAARPCGFTCYPVRECRPCPALKDRLGMADGKPGMRPFQIEASCCRLRKLLPECAWTACTQNQPIN